MHIYILAKRLHAPTRQHNPEGSCIALTRAVTNAFRHQFNTLLLVHVCGCQASRGKARISSNHQNSSPPFCKMNARPTSVPFFIRETDPAVLQHPRRSSGSSAGPDYFQVGKEREEARLNFSSGVRVVLLLEYLAPCWSLRYLGRR